MLKDKLNQDLKTALLEGNKMKAEVLKMLKSAILYEEVAQKAQDKGLSAEQEMVVVAREVKKRTESANMYEQAGQKERAEAELSEKAIIEKYLPQQLGDAELDKAIAAAVKELGDDAPLGKVIGAVKAKVGQAADGARIAAAVKIKLSKT